MLPVRPGEQPPEEGDWHTLYFLPGLHDIGPNFTVHSDKRYYIPGEAVVCGTLTNDDWDDGRNVTIFGHGTLSGDRLPHPDYSGLPQDQYWTYRPIHIRGTHGTTVEGVELSRNLREVPVLGEGPCYGLLLVESYTVFK